MLLAFISFVGIHNNPVTVCSVTQMNAIPILRNIQLTKDHVTVDLFLPNRLPDSCIPLPPSPWDGWGYLASFILVCIWGCMRISTYKKKT